MNAQLALTLALTLTAAAPAQDGPMDIPVQGTLAEPTGTSRFGEPLVVNGKQIDDLEIMRFLLYGKGRGGVESRKMEVLLDQEWKLRRFMKRAELLDEEYDGKGYDELSGEQQIDLNVAVEEALALYTYSADELEQRIRFERQSFEERYPTLDYRREIERTYKSWDWYIDQIEQTLMFDNMFFPGHPDNWPAITIESVHAGSPAFDLIEDYAKAYVARMENWNTERSNTEAELLQARFDGRSLDALTDEERATLEGLVDEEHGHFPPREEEMMMSLLRDFLIQTLVDPNLVTIADKDDGLASDKLLTLTGGDFEASVDTLTVWEEFADSFSPEDVAEAKQFIALMVATTDRMMAEGTLMPWSEYRDLLAQTQEELSSGMFSYGFLALQGHNFPSIEAYNEYLYLMESFRRSIIDEISLDENQNLRPRLQEYMPIGTGIMGLAKIQVEALLVSAFDFPNNEWMENGWEDAKAEAFDLRKQVDDYIDGLISEDEQRRIAIAEGVDFEAKLQPFDQFWADLLDLHSDYWDPPLPATGKMPAMVGMRFKGRFNGQPQTRNDLKRALNESTYTHFLRNENVVDEAFFNLDEGQVGGPYKGPWGYYIIYSKKKLRPSQPVNYRDERQLGLLQEDLLRREFTAFAHESLEKAEVSGL